MAQEQPEERQEAVDTAERQPDGADEASAEQRLMAAAAACDGPLVVQLLRDGAEPSCETEDGITPLMLAAESGCAEAVQALLGALGGWAERAVALPVQWTPVAVDDGTRCLLPSRTVQRLGIA